MHILWIKTELLHPVDKGGRIRTYQMLRALKEMHRLTYLALDDGTAAPDAVARATEYCHDVVTIPFAAPRKWSVPFWRDLVANLLSPLPYAIARYRSSAMRAAIHQLVQDRDIDLVVCDFLAPSVNVPTGLPVPVVLFQHNVEAAIWKRHVEVARDPLRRLYVREQWRRMSAFEAKECRRYDRVIAVSDADRITFERDYGVQGCAAVPTGVDVDYFLPTGNARRDQPTIVFTGSMDWVPNEDGCAWFVGDILPLVRREIPDAVFEIVGRNPSAAVQALAGQAPGIVVTGSVPDVRPYLERAAAFVVPLRVGGGTRLKIYEAMAMEAPVVSTTIGAEGLPVEDGVEIAIADDAPAFAAAVVRLLRDRATATSMAVAAATRVRSEFGWPAVSAAFARLCEETLTEVSRPRSPAIPQGDPTRPLAGASAPHNVPLSHRSPSSSS